MSTVLNFDKDDPQIERIRQLMADPPDGSVVLEFTPGVAKHVLKHWHGKHNRTAKTNAIKRYQHDMENDGWKLNGSTIVFTDAGVLGDGQNRLMACVRAGKPFKSHTVFGISHSHFYSIDQGRVRNPDDVLHMEGVANSRVVAQAVRWAELLATDRVKQRTVFDPPTILRLYRTKHKRVEDFLAEARRIASRTQQPVPIVAAMLYTFDNVDSDFAAEFSEAWATGATAPPFHGIAKMQAVLWKLKNTSKGRVHETVRAAMIVNAWNVARGKKRGSVNWSPDMLFPVIR